MSSFQHAIALIGIWSARRQANSHLQQPGQTHPGNRPAPTAHPKPQHVLLQSSKDGMGNRLEFLLEVWCLRGPLRMKSRTSSCVTPLPLGRSLLQPSSLPNRSYTFRVDRHLDGRHPRLVLRVHPPRPLHPSPPPRPLQPHHPGHPVVPRHRPANPSQQPYGQSRRERDRVRWLVFISSCSRTKCCLWADWDTTWTAAGDTAQAGPSEGPDRGPSNAGEAEGDQMNVDEEIPEVPQQKPKGGKKAAAAVRAAQLPAPVRRSTRVGKKSTR